MKRIRIAVLVGAAALTVAASAPAPAAPTTAAMPVTVTGDHYTPLTGSVLAEPHPVVGADGHLHLAYELMLANPLPDRTTVTRLEVLDAGHRNRVIDDLTGPRLTAALTVSGGGSGPTVGAGQGMHAILDVVLPASARPRELVHRITVAAVSNPVLANPFLAGRTSVAADSAVVLDPPLRGPRWVDLSGCCDPNGHRIAIQPLNGGLYVSQRFALDIVQLSPDGLLFDGPADQVTSFPYYGTPVLAAAAGVVVEAHDDQPDQIPFAATPPGEPRTILGNGVIVDIGHGRFTAYAHLKPGSVRVAVGQRVRAGQQIGQLGNSGNSDLPHLHFQVMDSPSMLASDGLPFVWRSFDSPGSVPPLDQIDVTGPIPIGPALAGHYQRVIPMNSQVMDFAGG